MPTGYTADVENGKITDFPTFALLCARAFGALIDMRDDPLSAPIPDVIEPQTGYYDRTIAQAQARLDELMAMTPEQVRAAAEEEHGRLCEEWERSRERRELELGRYQAMLDQVEAWTPPTPDHEELKTFMAKQLRASMPAADRERYWPRPEPKTGAEWLSEQLASTSWSLSYNAEKRQAAIDRAAERNAWVQALRDSLREQA